MAPRKDEITIDTHLPYELASRVMRQGLHCDAFARRIRRELPEWLGRLANEAYDDLVEQERTADGL
jgi:hypothetical protein